eukprot:Rmarinus@m.1448
MSPQGCRVAAVVRVRPPHNENRPEVTSVSCQVSRDGRRLLLRRHPYEDRTFSFDRILGGRASQRDVYSVIARPIVHDVLNGFNGTIIAYGQTGSGKTHTMFGPPAFWQDTPAAPVELSEFERDCGVIPRAVDAIFSHIANNPRQEFLVTLQFCEIYMEFIKCLLDGEKTNLSLREHPNQGVYVEGVTELEIHSLEEFLDAIREGARNRATFATNMNATSSRSHAILSVCVEQCELSSGDGGKQAMLKTSVFRFVDLAGSERVSRSLSEGPRLEEAKRINKSLAALSNCISALAAQSVHVPFRDSKLTRLLSDGLGGNSKTCMCATVSPDAYDYEETISTLSFLTRAMRVETHASVNRVIHSRLPGEDNMTALRRALDNARAQHPSSQPLGGHEEVQNDKDTSDRVPADVVDKFLGQMKHRNVLLEEELRSMRSEMQLLRGQVASLDCAQGESVASRTPPLSPAVSSMIRAYRSESVSSVSASPPPHAPAHSHHTPTPAHEHTHTSTADDMTATSIAAQGDVGTRADADGGVMGRFKAVISRFETELRSPRPNQSPFSQSAPPSPSPAFSFNFSEDAAFEPRPLTRALSHDCPVNNPPPPSHDHPTEHSHIRLHSRHSQGEGVPVDPDSRRRSAEHSHNSDEEVPSISTNTGRTMHGTTRRTLRVRTPSELMGDPIGSLAPTSNHVAEYSTNDGPDSVIAKRTTSLGEGPICVLCPSCLSALEITRARESGVPPSADGDSPQTRTTDCEGCGERRWFARIRSVNAAAENFECHGKGPLDQLARALLQVPGLRASIVEQLRLEGSVPGKKMIEKDSSRNYHSAERL